MLSTYKREDCYTAREVAEIRQISKQAVVDGCRRGQYEGAYQDVLAPGPNKPWLIPKQALDQPTMQQDVAIFNHQLTPFEVQKMLAAAMSDALERTKQELKHEVAEEFTAQSERLYDRIDHLENIVISQNEESDRKAEERDNKLMAFIRVQQQEKQKSRWQKLKDVFA